MCITKQDEVFPQLRRVFDYQRCEAKYLCLFGSGENIRDWTQFEAEWVISPYSDSTQTVSEDQIPRLARFMWPYKLHLLRL